MTERINNDANNDAR